MHIWFLRFSTSTSTMEVKARCGAHMMEPKTKCQKDVYCTIHPSFIFPSFPLHSMHIHFQFLCLYVPVSPCLPGFPCPAPSLSASFSLVLRTCRWHGAWPDKVIPQCRGLPGRDSLDTVSPLLARCRLQREGRPELEWGGKKKREMGEREEER